jgi:hypothetical protein
VLQKFTERPPIPLGTAGTLRGEQVLIVGWMRRSCVVEGETYFWEELLLYARATASFLWLVVSDGHWSLARPLSAGEVADAWDATYRGRTFKRFGDVVGVVDEVLGEFYWAVSRGDQAQLIDFVAPPEGLSVERTADEVNWSHCQHLDTDEIEKAFSLTAPLPKETGVGLYQPWPLARASREVVRWAVAGMGLLVAVLLGLAVTSPKVVLLEQGFESAELTPDAPEPGEEAPPGPVHSFLSEDLELKRRGPVLVRLKASVNNAWAAASGALVNQDTGELAPFSVEVGFYSGVEDGERWSEGETEAEAELGAVEAGKYLLRVDLQWDPKLSAPPPMQLTVRQGGVSVLQFLAALLALGLPLGLLLSSRHRFEQRRWEGSALSGGSAPSAGPGTDDEEDE